MKEHPCVAPVYEMEELADFMRQFTQRLQEEEMSVVDVVEGVSGTWCF